MPNIIFIGGLIMAQISIPPVNYSPVIPVEVKRELRVREIRKQTGKPFFLAALFIPEMLWTTRINNLDEVLDNYVKYEAGNSTRVFLFSQCWHPEYCKWNLEPFERDDEGKFIMPNSDCIDTVTEQCKVDSADIEAVKLVQFMCVGKYINPEWEAQVIERIKKVVRRKIMLIISLWDNCGFHYRQNCSWDKNFLNPDNNNINTSSHADAYYTYSEFNIFPATQNTGKIVEAMTRYMLNRIYDSLSPKERKYIAIEACNEGYSGTAWHMRMKKIIDETWGQTCPRWRRFTSTEAETSERTNRHFTKVFHQIGDLDSYFEKIWEGDFDVKGISTDGWRVNGQYAPIPIPINIAKRLLRRAYADELVLMEMLNGHRQNHIRLPNGIHNTTPDKYYYDHSAIRWNDMRKLGKLLLKLTK